MTLVERLREHIQTIRRKPTPIADLIPLLAEAADALERHESKFEAVAVVTKADNINGFVFSEIDGRMRWLRYGDFIYMDPTAKKMVSSNGSTQVLTGPVPSSNDPDTTGLQNQDSVIQSPIDQEPTK